MTDIFTPEKRSEIMSKIRSKDTGPEKLVRRILRTNGFRFKSNDRSLPGSPDIVLKEQRTVIFVNGCFWHGHRRCRIFRMPKTKKKFWVNKIEKNRHRDVKRVRQLRRLGWKVITVWECQLRRNGMEVMDKVFKQIAFKEMPRKVDVPKGWKWFTNKMRLLFGRSSHE